MPVADVPAFAELIANDRARAAFAELGFSDPRFSSGYVISKPPRSPALFWHQDWWGWDDPISYTAEIAQVFLFYYLTDTSRANGCLRLIRGSHRRRHPLHEAPKAHADDVARVVDPDDRIYQPAPDEVAVPVRAGDLVIGDARVLHGSYPNGSDQERTLITLWFHPSFAALPEPMRARIYEIYVRKGSTPMPAATCTRRSGRNPSGGWSSRCCRCTRGVPPRSRGTGSPSA